MTYFISDLHYGHEKIIKFCKRPFENVSEMNDHIVERWNATVKDRDEVFILGDIAIRKHHGREFLERTRGRKHLVIGNHDEQFVNAYAPFLESVSHIRMYKERGYKVVLCHYPLFRWSCQEKGASHLHGHVHGSVTNPNERCMDVAPDAMNHRYEPVSFEEIVSRVHHD